MNVAIAVKANFVFVERNYFAAKVTIVFKLLQLVIFIVIRDVHFQIISGFTLTLLF